MKVIWVLENIKTNTNSKDYYINSKFNVLLLLSSVYLWKKNHPEDTCVLYADDLSIDFFDKLKVLNFWDSIQPIPNSRRINKDVFWAAPKVEVLSNVTEPVILMDHDTHVYKPLKPLLDNNKVYVCHFEQGEGYYPTNLDSNIRKLSYKTRWKSDSVNVGFLYLPDPKFTSLYAETSLKIMEEFTQMEVPNAQYLIFAEQLLLKHLLDKHNVEHSSIISTYYNCYSKKWSTHHDKGLFKYPESNLNFLHYGDLKGKIKNNLEGFRYEEECKRLLNCINLPTLDLSKLPQR